MANIATLATVLTARASAFEVGMKKAQGILRNFGGVLSRTRRLALSWGTALVAAAAGGGLGLLLRRQFEAIDSTAKFADVIGLSTEKMAGYQLAAGITGVEVGQLNTGLTRLNKTISDAEAGSATATRELGKLGLRAQDLKAVDTDERLKRIAERFTQLNSVVDKSSVLLNVFGRAGLPLGKLLETGRRGIERFQAEAVRLGLAFDRLSAAKIEQANDAILRMRALITGVVRQLAIHLAPFITAAAEKITEMGLSGEGAAKAVVGGFEWILRAAARVANAMDLLTSLWHGFRAGVLEAGATILRFVARIEAAVMDVGNTISRLFGRAQRQGRAGGLHAVAEAMQDEAARSRAAMTTAAERFAAGTLSEQVEGFFEALRRRAEDVARQAERRTTLPDLTADEPARAGRALQPGRLAQIDLRRVFIGGAQAAVREQPVKVKQLDETNSVLRAIERKLGATAVAV